MPDRNADRAPLPGEYAVLGLLALEPRHGYELARVLEEELAAVCPVEQSLLYAYLRNLERRDLVEWEEVRVGARPPRKIFGLTEDGWSVFRAWVHAPVERMREVRQDFLLKVYFLRTLDSTAERRLIRAQIAACEQYVAAATRDARDADGFARLVADSKRTAGEATLTWLRAYPGGSQGRGGKARAS
ncbi:MAG: PadR family transcriptional regulator [Dehalococcoidia bacterium]